MPGEAKKGARLFLASVLAFALFDLGSLASPRLKELFPAAPVGAILAYALLGALALALAFLFGTLSFALRARRLPKGVELVRASLALFVVVLHLGLLVRAARR
ncbi:MAG TPA: hypothetical protein VLV17_01850 [Anaeromyxobacteraceae bacterium]|nr:hypothetical protein [Anaeromyxobacteraceae bacterium]